MRKLGLAGNDRAVIIHTDDIGMCQASVAAFAELDERGIISSGAIMVPCPWFLLAAEYARAHPHTDLGVHLTLTSEWKTYRWGPVSTRDAASGLIDEQGYFFHQTAPAQEHGDPAAAEVELDAQVQRAIQAGLAPTHIDTHMGTVAHPKFMPIYLQLAVKYRLAMMLPRLDEAGWRGMDMDEETAIMAAGMVEQLEAMGLPLLDKISGMPLDSDENRMERTKAMLSGLQPGLTHFIIHPCQDTPEVRAITPDWRCRVADYRDFLNEELRDHLHKEGIHIIGYRALQELMPA